MRRTITILLALVMVLSLAACGGSAPAATAAPAATEAPAAEAAEPAAELPPESRGVLRVGMECAYAPNNWQESAPSDTNVPIENLPGGYAEGYDVQIAKLIGEQTGYDIAVMMLAWDGLIEALNQGQIDMIIAGMADTAARREAINFSDPYHVTEYGIMLDQNSPFASAKTIHDFAGASVLGQKDTMLDSVIDQMEGVEHLTPVSSVPNMISRLQEGTCDAIVVNVENSGAYLDANPNFTVVRFAQGDGFDLGFVGACVGLRKSDDALLAEVNAALATIDDAMRDELWNTAVENQPR